MSTHNMCFHGELRKKKWSGNPSYLEVCVTDQTSKDQTVQLCYMDFYGLFLSQRCLFIWCKQRAACQDYHCSKLDFEKFKDFKKWLHFMSMAKSRFPHDVACIKSTIIVFAINIQTLLHLTVLVLNLNVHSTTCWCILKLLDEWQIVLTDKMPHTASNLGLHCLLSLIYLNT